MPNSDLNVSKIRNDSQLFAYSINISQAIVVYFGIFTNYVKPFEMDFFSLFTKSCHNYK
jgi:hypothetical protein